MFRNVGFFNVINSPDNVLDLHSDLDRLGSWADKVGMTPNSKKSKVMHVTRKRKPFESTYQLSGSPLVRTKAEKNLRVWISDDLSWSKQVSEMCTKANRTLGYVRRNSRTIRSTSIRRSMYLALVRPHLGYATQVWAPQRKKLIRQVERIQRPCHKVYFRTTVPLRYVI